MNARKLARALGWFSLGLGAAELFAGRRLGRMLGAPHRSGLLRFFGMRELAAGAGIFASDQKKPWLWGRVAGDAIDLAALLPTLAPDNPRRKTAFFALANVAGVTALDVLCARSLRA